MNNDPTPPASVDAAKVRELLELEKCATAGPWRYVHGYDVLDNKGDRRPLGDYIKSDADLLPYPGLRDEIKAKMNLVNAKRLVATIETLDSLPDTYVESADGHFIAALRNLAKPLCLELLALREQVEKLDKELDHYKRENGAVHRSLTDLRESVNAKYWEGIRADNGKLQKQLEAVTAERDHWKANHDEQVRVKRMLLDRPDLGDRAASIQRLQARLAEVEGVLARVTTLVRQVEIHCPCGARPESLDTHPHVPGCPVALALEAAASPPPASVKGGKSAK